MHKGHLGDNRTEANLCVVLWIHLAQTGVQERVVMSTVMNIWIPHKVIVEHLSASQEVPCLLELVNTDITLMRLGTAVFRFQQEALVAFSCIVLQFF
jgi:hypothetical protein